MPQHGAAALGKLLPGDKIRVMLHLSEQDLIARLDVRVAPAPRDGIDARRCPIGENALLGLRGVDEGADRFPGLVEQFVGLLGQLVDAAMHVGIMLFVATDDRLDDLARVLRAGRVVEIDQRHAGPDLAAEDGEIFTAGQGVQRRGSNRASLIRRPDLPRRGRAGAAVIDGRVDGRLQHPPRKQAALLPVGCEADAEQLQHVIRRECLDVFHRAAVEFLHDHRGRRLADAATVAIEEQLAEGAAVVDLQFHADDVAAEGIVILMGVRAVRAVTAMIRILVVIENMVLVQVFFVGGHGRLGKETNKAPLSLV